jgi:hypothetical protein
MTGNPWSLPLLCGSTMSRHLRWPMHRHRTKKQARQRSPDVREMQATAGPLEQAF